MKKPETPEARAITFTKRRSGLLTKAAELCMMCDSQVAMLVNSPKKRHGKNKIYSFGHSSIHSVFNAFLDDHVPDATAHHQTKISASSLYNQSKASEKDHDQYVQNKKRKREINSGSWWQVEDLDNIQSVQVLCSVIDKMKTFKEKVKMFNILNSDCDASKYVYNFDQTYDCNAKKPDERLGVDYFKGNHNGTTHFKHGNNVNDYNPSFSSVYDPNFVNRDCNRIVPESAYSFGNVGQIVEGKEHEYGFQQTATSSASNYVYNFDQSYVGGEYNTKKADECMRVDFKDKEDNSWAITAQNLPNPAYLNQDGVYNAKLGHYWTSADSTFYSTFLNVGTNNDAPLDCASASSTSLNAGNNDAPFLITDVFRTLDYAYQNINVNSPLPMSVAGPAKCKDAASQ